MVGSGNGICKENGWVAVRKKKDEQVASELKPRVDTIDLGCCSVPQLPIEQLNYNTSGIAFVRPLDAQELVSRPKANVPQAILCTRNITDTGVRVIIPVKDEKGRPQELSRFLIQTGTPDVTVNLSDIPVGGAITATIVRVVAILGALPCDKPRPF